MPTTGTLIMQTSRRLLLFGYRNGQRRESRLKCPCLVIVISHSSTLRWTSSPVISDYAWSREVRRQPFGYEAPATSSSPSAASSSLGSTWFLLWPAFVLSLTSLTQAVVDRNVQPLAAHWSSCRWSLYWSIYCQCTLSRFYRSLSKPLRIQNSQVSGKRLPWLIVMQIN